MLIRECALNSVCEQHTGPTEGDILYEKYKDFLRDLVKKYNLTRNSFFVKYDLALPDVGYNDNKNLNKKIAKILEWLKKRYPKHKKKAVLYKLLSVRCLDALYDPLRFYHDISYELEEKYIIYNCSDEEKEQVEIINKKLERIKKKSQFAIELKAQIKEFIKLIDDEFNIELPDNDGYSFFGNIEDELE